MSVHNSSDGTDSLTEPSIVLTVDVEDWYHTADLQIPIDQWPLLPRRVEKNTHFLLDMFDEYGATGTFFVLGCVAQESPQLVREIVQRGHELASHGTNHQLLTQMSRDEVREDIYQSKALLEHIAGEEVTAFRAPSWSLEPRTYYVLELLEELGFQLDSSIQPFHTPLSGVHHAPLIPFRPVVGDETLNIVEWPSTVASFAGFRVPFSGGLYLRTWPTWISLHLFNYVAHSQTPMVYLHPWEFDHDQPRVLHRPYVRFTHYFNLSKMARKLRVVLSKYNFVPFRTALLDERRFDKVGLSSVANVKLSSDGVVDERL